MPHVVILPFPPLPTKNRHSELICVDQRLSTAYFCIFFGPLEPHLRNFEPGKLVKLLSSPINMRSYMALIIKTQIVALMWAFWGPLATKWVTIYRYYYQKILETPSCVTQTKTSSISELYPCMHQPHHHLSFQWCTILHCEISNYFKWCVFMMT